jgi:hypothetical protein
MAGGDLHWIWKPYALYQNVDHVYGLPSFESGDGFTNAQSLLNIFENILNLTYVYQAHVLRTPIAPLTGLIVASLTLAKTILYWAQEYYCNYCAVGHNSTFDLVLMWIIPNGLWLIIPSLIIATLYRDVTKSLRLAARTYPAGAKTNGKSH